MSFTVLVDHETCIGIGVCEMITPELFAVTDGRAGLLVDPDGSLLAGAQEAASGCPMGAISVEID